MMGTLAAEMIGKWMKEYEGKLLDTADFIFCHPEVSLKEKASSRALAGCLEQMGFSVQWELAGFETAFAAQWGSGHPVIGFLAEYDALPGLGQEVTATHAPTGEAGHGCGHNLLGTACAGAAGALKAWMEKSRFRERSGLRLSGGRNRGRKDPDERSRSV